MSACALHASCGRCEGGDGGGGGCGVACRFPGGRGHGPPGLRPACWLQRGCSWTALGAGNPNLGQGPPAKGCAGGVRPPRLAGEVAGGEGGGD